MRASSLTYEKRALKIDSSTTLVPGAVHKNATICGCKSVGKPGYGAVRISVPPVMLPARTRDPILAGRGFDSAFLRAFEHDAQDDRGCSRVTVTSPRVTAPAEQQRSGNDAIGNDFVFDAVQFFNAVDRHRVGADAGDLRAHRDEKVCEVDDFGLHRDVVIVVVPSATTLASSAFLVAPTLGMRKSMLAPCKRLCLLSAIR